MKRFWLIKSEPTTFSIQDLERMPNHTGPWDGVRNYQARNFMRDGMRVGDDVLFYHSSCAVPGIVGLAKVASEVKLDETAFDPKSEGYDPKATKENQRWILRDMQWVRTFENAIPLSLIKKDPILKTMIITRPGNRLSITPVEALQYQRVLELGK